MRIFMEAAFNKEMNILSENTNEVKQRCEEERKNFVLSRSLPLEKMNDPSTVQPQAEKFLNCYTDMVQNSKKNCGRQYGKVKECLEKRLRNNDIFPEKCVGYMEDFMF